MKVLVAGALAALMLSAAARAQSTGSVVAGAPQGPPPPPCAAPEFSQFDFWIGRWDVYPTGKDVLVAHSLIEGLYNGCAVRENWMPLKGPAGGSLSGYSPGLHGWRQTWIGGGGGWVDFRGGFDGKAMVLTGVWPHSLPDGSDGLVRMSYIKGDDGSVRQFGEISADGGKTWQPSFDFTYKRSKEG